MMHTEAPDDNRSVRVELVLSTILRTGVLVSFGLIVVGTILTFAHHPDYVSSMTALGDRARSAGPTTDLRAIARGLLALRGFAIVDLGLLSLIATPVLRVAVSIFIFGAQRDRRFMLITILVLALLLLSFALGRAGG
jgi:uncharacterized membrane protein